MKIAAKDRIRRIGLSCDLTIDGTVRHFNRGYEYVDLGLPSGLLWARCNVGANSETESGNYYRWGEGKKTYQESWEGEMDCDAPFHDTAREVMGNGWRMPTREEFRELVDNTTHKWCSINGVYGNKFISKNGEYVFFPAVSGYDNGRIYYSNHSFYWSASFNEDYGKTAYVLYFSSGLSCNIEETYCIYGFPVRSVLDKC